ncbi:MAG: hypothetical protein K0U59_01410 [Gammaproteobacteria bacterium]|nr:hypothetical protein [Gammaproteobacteria bacterium]
MKVTRILTPLAIAISAMMGAQQAAAAFFDESKFIVRIGASYADPDDANTSEIREDYAEGFDLKSETTWQISGVWMPVEHWGIELMYIGSADTDLDFKGASRDEYGKRFAEFKAESSSAYINWYMLDESCLFQPYFGVGVNYTDFHDESVKSGLLGATDGIGVGYSWGATAQLGVDFRFGRGDSFLINASVQYIESSPDISAYRSFLNEEVKDWGDIDYDPWVFNLGVGYAF